MSVRTGPLEEIKTAGAIAGTTVTAMSSFKVMGNSCKLLITTGDGGGCGSLSFTAEISTGDDTTYHDVIDTNSLWSQTCTTPDTAGLYVLDLEGLNLVPGDTCRLSFQAGTAAGTLGVWAHTWENPRGGGISVSAPDVVVNLEAIEVATELLDDCVYVDDGAWTDDVSKNFLVGGLYQSSPQTVTDGKIAPFQLDANGNLIESNSADILTALQIIDDWDESDRCKSNPIVGQAGVAGGTGVLGATVQRMTVATDDTVATDLTAIKTAVEIMDDWDESDRCKSNPIAGQAGVAAGAGAVNALTQRSTLASDDPLVAKTPALGTAAMVASAPSTIATDDTQFGAVGAAADVDGNIHGQLRYIGEQVDNLPAAVGQAAMAASMPVVLASDQTSIPTTCGGTRTVTSATNNDTTATTTSISADFDLKSVTMKLDGALAAAETVNVSIDAADGVNYDATLYSQDIGTSGSTSFSWLPSTPIPCESGDEITVQLSANTNSRNWYLRIVTDER